MRYFHVYSLHQLQTPAWFPSIDGQSKPTKRCLAPEPDGGDQVVTACSWLQWLIPAMALSPGHILALEETFQIHQLSKQNRDPTEREKEPSGSVAYAAASLSAPLQRAPGSSPRPSYPWRCWGQPRPSPAACPTLLQAWDTHTWSSVLGLCKLGQGLALVPHQTCIFSQLLTLEALVFRARPYHQID